METPRDSCIVVVTVERGAILAGNTEAEWVSSTCDNFHERGSMDMKYLIVLNISIISSGLWNYV